ncbi:helix-turn-helix domain-containing protein [Roseobacter sp. S98]|uniref:helix-turn-helix domain-containing protein n=1 Tax=Roseobacter algicola (ex Choi et al. 2025) (nom. illeg.) TaxID=3092138 RepID=UPI0035C6D48F
MISIPLPLILTAVALMAAVFTVTRRWLPGNARVAFTALALLIAALTFLVTLRFAWNLEEVIAVQRLLPFWIGPLAWLGCLAVSDRAAEFRRALPLHAGPAVAAGLLVQAFPALRIGIDPAIAVSYLIYAWLILRLWRAGPDRLSQVPVSKAAALRRLFLTGAGFLCVTLVLDSVIALDFLRTGGANVTRLLSFASLLQLVVLAVVLVLALRQPERAAPAASGEDARLVTRAADCLSETRLFTDPDLSLTRLARRIAVTDRALSEAINRHTGANVSQFINGFRVEEAAHLLRTTRDPIMSIGEQAGFLTRSNFYAEFQRVKGMSPGAWRKSESAV